MQSQDTEPTTQSTATYWAATYMTTHYICSDIDQTVQSVMCCLNRGPYNLLCGHPVQPGAPVDRAGTGTNAQRGQFRRKPASIHLHTHQAKRTTNTVHTQTITPTAGGTVHRNTNIRGVPLSAAQTLIIPAAQCSQANERNPREIHSLLSTIYM